mmetsp:Transcript_14845/g.42790  ORF Transcript_14845/g.42790 Transcript_14845/m.42790 type:complete len:439 (+) Transcript_14845:284-1600(+)
MKLDLLGTPRHRDEELLVPHRVQRLLANGRPQLLLHVGPPLYARRRRRSKPDGDVGPHHFPQRRPFRLVRQLLAANDSNNEEAERSGHPAHRERREVRRVPVRLDELRATVELRRGYLQQLGALVRLCNPQGERPQTLHQDRQLLAQPLHERQLLLGSCAHDQLDQLHEQVHARDGPQTPNVVKPPQLVREGRQLLVVQGHRVRGPPQLVDLSCQCGILVDLADPAQKVHHGDHRDGQPDGHDVFSQNQLEGYDADAEDHAHEEQHVSLRHQGDLQASAEAIHREGGGLRERGGVLVVVIGKVIGLGPHAEAEAPALDPLVTLDLAPQEPRALEALHLLHRGLYEGDLVLLQPLQDQVAHGNDSRASVELLVANDLVRCGDRVDRALLEQLQPSTDEDAERHQRIPRRVGADEALGARRDAVQQLLKRTPPAVEVPLH